MPLMALHVRRFYATRCISLFVRVEVELTANVRLRMVEVFAIVLRPNTGIARCRCALIELVSTLDALILMNACIRLVWLAAEVNANAQLRIIIGQEHFVVSFCFNLRENLSIKGELGVFWLGNLRKLVRQLIQY